MLLNPFEYEKFPGSISVKFIARPFTQWNAIAIYSKRFARLFWMAFTEKLHSIDTLFITIINIGWFQLICTTTVAIILYYWNVAGCVNRYIPHINYYYDKSLSSSHRSKSNPWELHTWKFYACIRVVNVYTIWNIGETHKRTRTTTYTRVEFSFIEDLMGMINFSVWKQ